MSNKLNLSCKSPCLLATNLNIAEHHSEEAWQNSHRYLKLKRDLGRVWVNSFQFTNHTAVTSLQRTHFKCIKGLEFKQDHQWSRDPRMTRRFISVIIWKPSITESHKLHISYIIILTEIINLRALYDERSHL